MNSVNSLLGLLSYFMFATAVHADNVKTFYMSEMSVELIPVSTKGMILSFPTKPSKVILGNGSSFAVEYVENDIAITPVSPKSRANLFVYMLGRRFSFDLVASQDVGHTIVLVRDQIESPPIANSSKDFTRVKPFGGNHGGRK